MFKYSNTNKRYYTLDYYYKHRFSSKVAKINLGLIAGFDQRSAQEVTLSKFRVAREAYENIEGIEKVQFIDEFEDNTPEEETEEEIPEVLNEEDE